MKYWGHGVMVSTRDFGSLNLGSTPDALVMFLAVSYKPSLWTFFCWFSGHHVKKSKTIV